MSRQPEEIYAERALRTGASGYWMKTGTREEFIRAIDTVLGGEVFVSPRITLRAVHEVVERPAAHPNPPNLTDRELHIFSLSGAGFGSSRIARELGIEPWKPITNISSSSWDTPTLTRFIVARASGSS